MELFTPGHLLVVVIVAAFLFFGWKQLPDMARSMGRSLRIFKTEIKGMTEDDKAREAARDAAAAQPAVPQAVQPVAQPVVQQPVAQPVVQQPVAPQPVAPQPVVPQPVVQQPVVQQPVVQQPVVETPVPAPAAHNGRPVDPSS